MPSSIAPLEITPREVKRRLDAGEKLRLVDVREPREFETARIDGTELIPMGDVPAALARLDDPDGAPLIVICHHGVRSLQVVNLLREHGVADCQSMAGGIERWSREIDASVPRYN